MAGRGALIPTERIERTILLIRGHKVILDRHLAELYGVTTGNLNRAVTRNLDRFPGDFMLQLTAEEFENLKFHFGTSSWGGTGKRPRAFTEQRVAMLSSVLRSKQSVAVNIEIMRAFVRIRELVAGRQDLILRLDALEARYDAQFRSVFDAIRALISDEDRPRKRIGFRSGEQKGSS